MRGRTLVVALFALCAWSIATPALSDAGNGHGQSLDDVLEEIRTSQGIGSDDAVDCATVTDEQMEELGEALMSIMHPDPEQHALMDRMMGGEGSPMLTSMHRMMGARYLGCYSGGMMGGMMGGGMMGSGLVGSGLMSSRATGTGIMGGPMMGGGMSSGMGGGYGMMGPGLGSIILWVILLAVVAALVYFLVRVGRTHGHTGGVEGTPLEILSRRYAKGEITKDQFEAIRKDLEKHRS